MKTVLFAGDSVTDSGRRDDSRGLGDGYVSIIAAQLHNVRVLNRGISGDRSRDLAARWDRDVVAESPDVLTILIGVNDTWRRFDENDPTTKEAFEINLRTVLETVRTPPEPRMILADPFLLPLDATQQSWRGDLDEKIAVVAALAKEISATHVPLDEILNAHANHHGASAIVRDGVHPTRLGHRLIADAWLERSWAGTSPHD